MRITQKRLKELLSYDPATGLFTWIKSRSHGAAGCIAGTPHNTGYTYIGVDGRIYPAHRLVWLYVHGEMPSGELDHRNGIKTDNRFANLRLASNSANGANKPVYKNNKCGLKGVHLHKPSGRWKAQIKKDGRVRHIGLFACPTAAHMAYVSAAKRLHGEYANAGS